VQRADRHAGYSNREDFMPDDQTVTLYRPVGPKELALIEASG
jgi:hypothetical protein